VSGNSVFIGSVSLSLDVARQLRHLGVRAIVTNVGTGHSLPPEGSQGRLLLFFEVAGRGRPFDSGMLADRVRAKVELGPVEAFGSITRHVELVIPAGEKVIVTARLVYEPGGRDRKETEIVIASARRVLAGRMHEGPSGERRTP